MNEPPLIALVEDRALSLKYFIAALRNRGFVVEILPDAETAAEVLLRTEVSLALIDLHIPLGTPRAESPFRATVEMAERAVAFPRPAYGHVLGAFLSEQIPGFRFVYMSAVPEDFDPGLPHGNPLEPTVLNKLRLLSQLVGEVERLSRPEGTP